jgi:hypothetical protein
MLCSSYSHSSISAHILNGSNRLGVSFNQYQSRAKMLASYEAPNRDTKSDSEPRSSVMTNLVCACCAAASPLLHTARSPSILVSLPPPLRSENRVDPAEEPMEPCRVST